MIHTMDFGSRESQRIKEIASRSTGHWKWLDMKLIERQGFMRVTSGALGNQTGELVRDQVLVRSMKIIDGEARTVLVAGPRFRAVLDMLGEMRG